MKLSRAMTYAACQFGGWGLYALFNAMLFRLNGRDTLPSWLACATALCLTHGARTVLPLRGWARLPLLSLAPRVLATAVGLGLAQELVVLLVAVFVLRDFTLDQASWGGLFATSFVWTFMMLMWLVLYFVVHTAQRARHAEVERWRLEAAARDTELRFLKAQLQPHFLFNCLNSLRALIAEDPARAQEVVTRLSALLRYALGARNPEMVPLERELQVVRDYLGLESMRFEERLRVREDVEPAALGVPVPAMLLQTLVENAIKHGVAQRPEGGEVAVSAHVREGALVVEVANTPAPRSGSTLPEGNGVGLHNASERLRLLCGERASLQLDQTQATSTTARVRIPLEAA